MEWPRTSWPPIRTSTSRSRWFVGYAAAAADDRHRRRHRARHRHHRHALARRLRQERRRRAARLLHDAGVQRAFHRELHGALDLRRQDLWAARRRVGAGDVLQQGPAREGRRQRAAHDLGWRGRCGQEGQGSRRRRHLWLRSAGQGNRDRRLLVLLAVDPRRRDHRERQVGRRQPRRDRGADPLQKHDR